ncbi:hypothetical protein WICPIJ_004408 [Wickerhamomyces pijperi]|uniref:Uncharacterized protein n=1 Tax=Wickerhamomyces pijperi TaxID=599730 RepID=A0A9P8TMY1_WICPI|nr:hypothetical protein WICPIJ_004408 [Wickerhamomyces pijperi]
MVGYSGSTLLRCPVVSKLAGSLPVSASVAVETFAVVTGDLSRISELNVSLAPVLSSSSSNSSSSNVLFNDSEIWDLELSLPYAPIVDLLKVLEVAEVGLIGVPFLSGPLVSMLRGTISGVFKVLVLDLFKIGVCCIFGPVVNLEVVSELGTSSSSCSSSSELKICTDWLGLSFTGDAAISVSLC